MARVRVLVKALLALVGLLAVIAGIPVLLTVLAGSPIPQVWPTPAQVMAAVQHPDDGTLLIGVLKYIGWAAWLSFTGSVLTQLVAQVRHIQAPRIPGFVGAPVAARLVATILAVGAITSVASPVGAAHAVAAPTDAPSPATTTSQTVTVTEQVPHAVTVADFNRDGRQDLGVFALVPGGPFTPYVWLRPDKPATAQPDAKSK